MGKEESDFVPEKEVKLFSGEEELKIGRLSHLTGVKEGTIRFYEKCGFLEPAKRLPNGYRVFYKRHIYQIRVCRLVFGGFVNKRLRKISREILQASRDWNLEAYRQAADGYLQAVEEDIRRTKIAVDFVMNKLQEIKEDCSVYTKKQAAGLVGVTSETIRNWERNGLFRQKAQYEKRLYSQPELNRMYVIRLLMDNGYSMMAVQSFFREYDEGGRDMDINCAEIYLKKNEKKLLAGGKSGARVYDIGGEYVLKQIYRSELGNNELYEAYRKEAWWYAAGGADPGCLPEVLDLRSTDDEIAILMKRYQTLSRREINTELLEKIMRTLASVHAMEIPPLLKQKQHMAQPLLEEQIRVSVEGWRTVLDEHPGAFDGAPLERIAGEINRIIFWHGSEETVLSHGDFHWDNLLIDNQGRIIICDWQGVEAGAASGDLSFFFGRLRGDGIQIKEEETVEAYGREIRQLSGKRVTWEEICGHIRAANVITSFTCWHQYLHGSDEGRVREIYGKMVTDSDGIW